MSYQQTGIPTPEMIRSSFPDESRLENGRVAVIECYQKIPCNPCVAACRLGAITVGEDINELPKLNPARCTGCGNCIAKCPGLSIFTVDCSREEGFAELSLPYEFTPLPRIGQQVSAIDRAGAYVCEATVTEVLNPRVYDRTPIVRIRIPRTHMYDVRNFCVEAL